MSFRNAIVPGKPKFVPHTYQFDGIAHLFAHPFAGLFFPPGLGKTATTLSALLILLNKKVVDKVLVVAPLRVCYNVWPNEVNDWADFEHLSVGILHGKNKEKVLKEDHDIYCINPDGLQWLHKKYQSREFLNTGKWALVVDESTCFKRATSQRFKLLKKIAPKFDRRIILTGTPAPNGLINLWSQMYLLDLGKRLGQYVTAFRNRYFYPSGYMGYDYKLCDGADKRIYDAIGDIVLHKSQDELDLPDRLYNYIRVELPNDAMNTYEQMRKQMVAELQEQDIIAVNAAVAAGKLKQICSGGLYDPEGNPILLHDAKTDVVESLVNELDGRPLLVTYEYKHDLMRLLARFPNTPYIGGGVSEKETTDIIDRFNNGELPLLLLHPASAAHGLNLQKGGCHDVCWYSITYDRELYDQANARVHRQGVKNSVTIHHIVAKGTIDEAIVKLLDKKGNVQQALLDYLLE